MCNCGKCLCHTCKWTQMCSKVPCINCWAVIFDCKTDAGKLKPYLIPSLLSGRLLRQNEYVGSEDTHPHPLFHFSFSKWVSVTTTSTVIMVASEGCVLKNCCYDRKQSKLMFEVKHFHLPSVSPNKIHFFLHIVKDNLQILFFPCFKFSRKTCSLCMHL